MSNLPNSAKQDGYFVRLSIHGRAAIVGVDNTHEVPFRTKRDAGRKQADLVRDWRRGVFAYALHSAARTGFAAHNNSATRSAELRFRGQTVGRCEVLPNYVEVPSA